MTTTRNPTATGPGELAAVKAENATFRAALERITQPDCYDEDEVARVALGRTGGAQTSPAKRRAARANGKLGGRPKKQARRT